MTNNILIDYGLTEKEALIYQTMVEVGSAPVSSIARLAKLHRVVAYDTIKKLEKKGLVSYTKKKNVTYYTPVNPMQLEKNLKEKYVRFQEGLPALLALANKGQYKPRVQYFEGLAGLKNLYETILDEATELRSRIGVDYIDPAFLDYLENDFVPRRAKKKIRGMGLLPNTTKNKQFIGDDKSNYMI